MAVELGQHLAGGDVAGVLDRISRPRPERIRVDNGTEFTSKRHDQWAHLNGVRLEFSRRSEPTDNALIEAFNGGHRAECLSKNWFLSLDNAEAKVQAWRQHYNGDRLPSELGYLAHEEYAANERSVGKAG